MRRIRGGWVVFLAALVLADPALSRTGATVVGPEISGSGGSVESTGLGPARAVFAAADAAERRGESACVDLYYRAAVLAWADLTGPRSPGAPTLYNQALARCLHAATRHRRIDPRSRLHVRTPGGPAVIPIDHEGFVWSPADFHELVEPASLAPIKEQMRRRVRVGLGAPQVALRYPRGDASDRFFGRPHAIGATALLVPDLDAWLHPEPGRVPLDRLRLIDSLRLDSVPIDNLVWPLAADHDAPHRAIYDRYGGEQFRVREILNPEQAEENAGLYMFEPYQPGKIPVVLIHGLASAPWTWSDLSTDLRLDPEFRRRYQIWTVTYPSGLGFVRNAASIRGWLDEALATVDPEGRDPALRQMVLIGHSMGGLLATLQVTWSGRQIEQLLFRVPFEDLNFPDPAMRRWAHQQLYFEPRPYVQRVIYIATPHRGSTLSNALVQSLIRQAIRMPNRRSSTYSQIVRANPGAVDWRFRRQPTSVDLLENDHPLLEVMARLPRAPWVSFHSIIGVARAHPLTGRVGDGVVPTTSARIGGVQSEAFVNSTHTLINHEVATVAEVRRILGLPQAAPMGLR